MADVGECRERAQLLLVAGIALAVVLVALALILNSVIFTENLATRNEGSDIQDAAQFRGETYGNVAGSIMHVNDAHRGDDFSTLYDDRYRPVLRNVSDRSANARAVTGQWSNTTDEYAHPGTQIVDDNESLLQTFTPRSGAVVTWTVAENVTFRRYRITPNKDALAQVSLADVEGALRNEESIVFFVKFTDSRDRDWYVAVWRDTSDDMNVVSYNATADTFSQVCSSSATESTLDFATQTFDGTPCDAVEFTEDIEGHTTVEYWNGDLAAGTYRLVVDRGQESLRDVVNTENYGNQCTAETYYRTADNESPFTAQAVYSTIVDATYRRSSVDYDGEIYVEPEPVGPEAVAPTVTQFDVADSTLGDHEFTVTWDTSDPTDESVTVDLTLVDSGGNVVDQATGLSASGTQTLEDTALLALGPYTVKIDASDPDGNSRTVEQVHDDDGDDSLCPP